MKRIIAQIHKNVSKKKWKCILNNCSETAINSHLLQRNGILNNVAYLGHIIEVKASDIHSWSPKKPPITMKRTGVNNAFSIPLFCNYHDTTIFKHIESGSIDFNNYKTQLLLSYRVVCAEIRKKEISLEIHNRILNSSNLIGHIDIEITKAFLEGTSLGIKDLFFYKELLEKELENEDQQIYFKLFQYPLIKTYASATFSPLDYLTIDPKQENPFVAVYTHIIPYDNKLNIIVGYHKKYITDWIIKYVESWNNLSPDQLGKKITNLYAAHIENWGISPIIFNNIKKSTIDKFMKYRHENTMNYTQDQETDINIFENNNYGT